MAQVEWGTVGEWAAAIGTVAAVWVALRQPRHTIEAEAEHAGELEAMQVVAICTSFDQRGEHPDLPQVAATVKVHNFSGSVLRDLTVFANWRNGTAYYLQEYSSVVGSLRTEGHRMWVDVAHLAPSMEPLLLPIGANRVDPDLPDPTLRAVIVSWVDRGGVRRSTSAEIEGEEPSRSLSDPIG